MNKKCLIYLAGLLITAGALMAQTNAVFFDDEDLYGTGSGALRPIAEGITNYYKPAYGVLKLISDPFKLAESVSVTNGTITAGTVTNTWVEDADYLTVQETGVFEVYFAFSNSPSATPEGITFHGRYEGNPSHDVLVYAYDYVDGAYELVEPTSSDYVPSGTDDNTYRWVIPSPQTNFISTNGYTSVLFEHDGSAVSSHYIYFDYLTVITADAILAEAGTWYPFTAAIVDAEKNTTASTNATVTTIDAGMYRTAWYTSFTGSTNTTFTIRHLTNSSPTDAEMWRTIGSQSAIGSASAFGYEYQPASCTNTWEVKADTDNAWITIVNGHAEVKKVSN